MKIPFIFDVVHKNRRKEGLMKKENTGGVESNGLAPPASGDVSQEKSTLLVVWDGCIAAVV